jgi:hypothetical protein
MSKPILVPCDQCGAQATMQVNVHTGADGNRVEWPKAAVRPDGVYFALSCPQCGDRDQLMAEPSDTK